MPQARSFPAFVNLAIPPHRTAVTIAARTSTSPTAKQRMKVEPTTPAPISVGLKTVPEIPDWIDLPVNGTLPPYLAKSTLYRNGPGRYEATYADGKSYNVRHWFDGFALVHAFLIDASENSVRYRNRFISAPVIRAIENKNKSHHIDYSFGRPDPCRSLLSKFFQLFIGSAATDPVTGKVPMNTGVTIQEIPGKGKIVARTDSSANALLDPETLEVDHFFGFSKLNSKLCGPFSAAHGHLDEETGDFINFNFDLKGPGPVLYNVFRIKKDGTTEIIGSFNELPCYVHSFATTPNYVVMCLWPQHLDALRVLFNKSLLGGMKFNSEMPTKFVVLSRNDQQVVAKYESSSFFCFHTINAFERDDAIHIDLCKYKDGQVLDDLELENLFTGGNVAGSCVSRFTLDDVSTMNPEGKIGTARETILNEESLELPRIHPEMLRKDYRFVYGSGVTDAEDGKFLVFNSIAKIDVKTGERVSWAMEDAIVGEPIFVPDPDGQDEDDGVLLVVVLNCERRKSDMVVLDAKTMTEIASAGVPQVVPLGFHGKFKYA